MDRVTNNLVPHIFFKLTPFTILLLAVLCFGNGRENVTVTVRSGERQVFKGFGVGHYQERPKSVRDYMTFPEPVRDSILKFLYQDCNFRYQLIHLLYPDNTSIESWAGSCEKHYGVKGTPSNDYCVPEYGGRIRAITTETQKYQPNLITILQSDHYTGIGFDNWAKMSVHRAKALSEQFGIHAEYIITAGEPGTFDEVPPIHQPIITTAFRRALDEQGLTDMKVIGPDHSSADQKGQDMVKAILEDPEARDALAAFDTHSYNWSITDAMEELVEEYVLSGEKEYFQTEGGPGPIMAEFAENAEIASDVMSKVLGDLNHLCQVWLFYQGIHGVGAGWTDGNSEGMSRNGWYLTLVRPDYDDYLILLKAHYFKQLSRVINPGAVCRKSIMHLDRVNPEKYWRQEDTTMVFAHGLKAPLFLASALNQDGSWGIAVTNYTGHTRTAYTEPRPKMDYSITVKVEELVGKGDIDFSVNRCNAKKGDGPDNYIHPEGIVVMHGGELTIDSLGQFDMITLQSAPGTSVKQNKAAGNSGNRNVAITNRRSLGSMQKSISFSVPFTPGQSVVPVSITLFDMHGKQIAKVLDTNLAAGEHTVLWDGQGKNDTKESSGVYLIEIEAGRNKQHASIIL